jgi:acetoin utilization protein AcuB
MSLTCVTVPPTMPVLEARHLMLEKKIRHLTVGAVMSRNVVAIESDRELREAAQLMLDHSFGALPVIDGSLLVGIITETDLLRAFVHTV